MFYVRNIKRIYNKIVAINPYSFSELYQQYYKRAFLFVKSYVRDSMAAEDITSDTLIKLWQTIKNEQVDHPQALLLTMLRNNALNHLQHESVKQAAIDSISSRLARDTHYRITSLTACDPQEIFSAEITEIIQRTLLSLPEQTRRVFEMSRYEHKAVKEIATELSISPKAVEYHITRSLKSLRIALKEYLPLFYFLAGIS